MKPALRTALAAAVALILAAVAAFAQDGAQGHLAPPVCQQHQLSQAECRNLAAEQAKERTAQPRPSAAKPKNARRDPAVGSSPERGTLKQGKGKIEYQAR